MIAAQKENMGLDASGANHPPQFPKSTGVIDVRPTLAEADIDRKVSSRVQKGARI
jgi:hypothetical protein